MRDGTHANLMVTGGIRRIEIVERVLASGISIAGMGSALAIEPRLPVLWSQGKYAEAKLRPITWRHKLLAARAYMASITYRMRAISLGRMTTCSPTGVSRAFNTAPDAERILGRPSRAASLL